MNKVYLCPTCDHATHDYCHVRGVSEAQTECGHYKPTPDHIADTDKKAQPAPCLPTNGHLAPVNENAAIKLAATPLLEFSDSDFADEVGGNGLRVANNPTAPLTCSMTYTAHFRANMRVAIRCLVLFAFHAAHAICPIEWTSHEKWRI